MKLFADPKIKTLFLRIALCAMIFPAISILCIALCPAYQTIFLFIPAICMAGMVIVLCNQYFQQREQLFENAATQIREYLLGSQQGHIECNEEGAIYRLFHEVNSLITILNAHANSERKAKEFLRNTISDISHQLKTPVAALEVYYGILQQESADPATVQHFAALSEQELERIENLIQNILKISKLDAGIITLTQQPEDLSALLTHIQQHYAFRAEQEGKKIILEGETGITLYCDRTWLTEAIGNLIKNALDHTKAGDRIDIQWKQTASLIQIIIQDTGSGIHPEDQYHIFKRFYRSRFSKNTPGLGLGLPLAKAIIEANKGTIEADSRLGHGATFTVNFLIPTKL